MNNFFEIKDRTFLIFSYVFVVIFSIFPLLFSLPFRIHLDLPYEGAYRLYLGQAPYKDFGIPFGFGFFIVPTFFFHLFGSNFSSLLFGQVFLNIVSGATLISVLKSLKIPKPVIFLSAFVYCLSYIFIYFWPWHTHTAFTFGLIAIALILKYNEESTIQRRILIMICAGLFSFLSFFTKQDYGGLNLVFCLIILGYLSFVNKSIWALSAFVLAYAATAFICIAPWLKHGFGYWFNHGQAPHSSRLALGDFLNEIFMASDWEKFYLLVFVIILLVYSSELKTIIKDKYKVITFLICAGMILEALLTQVTSRNSTGTTTYFHAFAIAFILTHLKDKVELHKTLNIFLLMIFTFLWWSPMYWKYASRMFPISESKIPRKDNGPKVQSGWELSEFKTFKKIKLPTGTIEGIRRLKSLPALPKNAQVMNMTELTSLPEELSYQPLTGIPLWYDLGVSIFPEQVKDICGKIISKKYDMVLFEEVPDLDNYFPEEVRDILKVNYKKIDTFRAPRQEDNAFIEVYVRQ